MNKPASPASKATAVSKLPSDFRQQPISKVLGKLIKPAKRRKEWQEIVVALHEASLPGGARDGWSDATLTANPNPNLTHGANPS